MDSKVTICLLLGFLTILIGTTRAQVQCDYVNNLCLNGVCQLQTSGFLGCTCNPGFLKDTLNPLSCLPIPPCNLLQGTPEQQCPNGVCEQQANGQYQCTCNAGYQRSFTNTNMCEDVNECLIQAAGCAPNACINLPGDYSCSACNTGYFRNTANKCEKQTYRTNYPWWYWYFMDGWMF